MMFLKFRVGNYQLINLDMPCDVFLELVKLCVSTITSSFASDYCIQRIGRFMSLPLFPILGNLYMVYFETDPLPRICREYIVWYWYADDI